MSEVKIYLTNLKEVQQDFKTQDRHFHKEIAKSMKVIGRLLAMKQKTILGMKVMEWTGALSNSITVEAKRKSVTVGGTLKYTDWIEKGGRGGFLGYWYMKGSLDSLRGFIINRLKKDMGSTAKLKY
ncbi:MAG: hypothetical protein DRQ78_04715 [Epsilonproteobacteria bacterium]|nr:MAG: hypothetical protein DRQ78_04715 [Campylobacterota bacterium]